LDALDARTDVLESRVTDVEKRLSDLEDEVNGISTSLDSLTTKVNNLSNSLNALSVELQNFEDSTNTSMNDIDSWILRIRGFVNDLYIKIDKVKKMPGPQGPQGPAGADGKDGVAWILVGTYTSDGSFTLGSEYTEIRAEWSGLSGSDYIKLKKDSKEFAKLTGSGSASWNIDAPETITVDFKGDGTGTITIWKR
jgi:uncharacterized coiled-coil protein SlyX